MTEAYSTLMLKNVRLGMYVHLVTARQGKPRKDGSIPDPKFEIEGIISKDHPQFQEIKERQRAAVTKKFPSNAQDVLVAMQAKDKLFLHNGDATRIGKPGYQGMMYFSAKNKEQPLIIGQEGSELIATRETPRVLLPSHKTWPYPGCMVNLELDIWAMPNDGGLCGATVLTIQFAGHAQRLGMSNVGSVKSFGLVALDADSAAPSTQSQDSSGLI